MVDVIHAYLVFGEEHLLQGRLGEHQRQEVQKSVAVLLKEASSFVHLHELRLYLLQLFILVLQSFD